MAFAPNRHLETSRGRLVSRTAAQPLRSKRSILHCRALNSLKPFVPRGKMQSLMSLKGHSRLSRVGGWRGAFARFHLPP
jgi:hypothetical protein